MSLRASAALSPVAQAAALARTANLRVLVVYLLVSLAAGGLPVVATSVVVVVMDRVSGAAAGPIVVATLVLAATGLATAVAPPTLSYLQGALGRGVAMLAKDRLYRAVTRIDRLDLLETPAFRDQLRLAEQASRSGPTLVIDSALGMLQAAVTLTGLAATVMLISPWIALALTGSAVPILLAELRLSRQRAEMIERISPAERREFFYTDLLTNLAAAKELRLFGSADLFHRRMLDELAVVHSEQGRLDRRELRVQVGLASMSASLAGAALVWVLLAAAGRQVGLGAVGLGAAGGVIVAIPAAQAALANLVGRAATVHHAGLLLERYQDLLRQVETDCAASRFGTVPQRAPGPEQASSPGSEQASSPGPAQASSPAPGQASSPGSEQASSPGSAQAGSPGVDPAVGPQTRGIEFDDVWFRYGDGSWVLRGVNLTLAPTESVALVGENGSGKSTLVKLLCRFYDPDRGAIRWDGVDLRELPIVELRRRVGAVFQDFMSYDLSAAENIALGDVDGGTELDLSPERIVAAARAAQVHDVVSRLPRGYDTMLSRSFVDLEGDPGTLLSGGQWQRLALARALIRSDRPLLVFDEPSAGLDPEAEHWLHRHLASLRGAGTVLVISHRLGALRHCDRFVVLDAGQVVEQGQHEALIAEGGIYARLFERQAAGYLVAGG